MTPPDPAARQTVGRYVLVSRLGAGAFGTVYKAFDPQLKRHVALKVPNPGALANPKHAERFLREAQAAAGLTHPNIVPVFDAGRDGDRFYIAAAFIDGRPLADAIPEGGMDPAKAAALVRQLAEAVAAAHDAGVVHRDIKPANVLVDAAGRPHLTDFGLAAQADLSKLTNEGAVIGTPHYMAPEQAAGQRGEAKPAADQYSLGVVLYELLTGRTPFDGPPASVIYNAIHSAPPPPREVRPGVPAEVEQVCLKAMARKPENRFPDCRAFAAALDRCAAGASGERPPPAMTQARHWLVVAAAAGLLAVGIGVGITLSGGRKDGGAGADPGGKSDTTVGAKPGNDGAAIPGPGEEREFEIARGVKMRFCWVPAGTATLGSPPDEKERGKDEAEHEFTTAGFWLGKYEVTQAEWQAVMGSNPSAFDGEKDNKAKGLDTGRFPVESVSWVDCQTFLGKANAFAGRAGRFRLPNEDEWEYACRGGRGNRRPFYWGGSLNGAEANCYGDDPYGGAAQGPYLGRPAVVGSYDGQAGHSWGLCDMVGNVWEWCSNKYDGLNNDCVLRGGSWFSFGRHCRAAGRYWVSPGSWNENYGLRVVLPLD